MARRDETLLARIIIENFRCLRSVDVPLKPLTVLIGPNDSGKSTFLEALKLLASGREGTQIDRSDYWRQLGDHVARVTGTKRNGARLEGADARELQPIGFYRLPPEGILLESEGYSDQGAPPDIGAQGEMVPALLDYFLRRDRRRFQDVVAALQRLIPGLEEIEIATPNAHRRQLDLVVENGLRLRPHQVSAGVRLLMFFVALAYHPSSPRLIMVEEPENGIHPKRLADVVALLREIAEGKHGDRASQVILTTHSPYLLDRVDLTRDQVLVFRRNADGSRSAEPVDAERLKLFLDEFMLGEVWFNQSEEGLVARQS